jgi:glycosyltransferase involved in cell wall biosynthesis
MSNLISIIIPTYNRADFIIHTLESIRNQTFKDFECLVVDNDSTDKTQQIVNDLSLKDTRFQYHNNPIDKPDGPNGSRNYGFKMAKGKFIYFFDSDDLLKPYALETYLSNFNNQIDVVIGRLEKVEFKTGKFLGENEIESNDLIADYFKGIISFYVCGPMWRKSFLDKQEQLFDENIRNLDDFDFNLRMIYAQPQIVFLKDILITYFQHPNSLKKELLKLNSREVESAFFARDKHLSLLKSNQLTDIKEIENIIIEHRKEILRLALLNSNPIYFDMLIPVLKHQLKSSDVFGLFKIVAGVLFYRMFRKGYSLLK